MATTPERLPANMHYPPTEARLLGKSLVAACLDDIASDGVTSDGIDGQIALFLDPTRSPGFAGIAPGVRACIERRVAGQTVYVDTYSRISTARRDFDTITRRRAAR